MYLTSFHSQLEEVYVFKNIRKKPAIIVILILTDLTAIHPEYDTLFIEQSNVNLNFISTIFNKLTFDIIEIRGLETSLIPKTLSISNLNQNQHQLKFPFSINHFFISGSFPFQITDSLFMVSGILAGELSGGAAEPGSAGRLAALVGFSTIDFK